MSSQNIAKTRARLEKRIEEGQYYEAHQQLRVVSQRYVKAQKYPDALEILTSGANALFKAGQAPSAIDLCLLILEIYRNSQQAPDAVSKSRILDLISQMPASESLRKRFINEAVAWSAKFGEFPAGDPDLHHFVGTLYAGEGDVYEAEKHLLLGTTKSAETLANALYEWYSEDAPHTAPFYIARAVLPYMLIGNLRDANRALGIFIEKLVANSPGLVVQEVDSGLAQLKIFPSLPLLNFLSLMVLAVRPGGRDVWAGLRNHYITQLKEAQMWNEALDQIGESYFDVQIRRQTNILDMMGSLFGGPSQPAIGGTGAAALD